MTTTGSAVAATPLTITLIGTGVMGRSIGKHLMNAGHRLRVHTRTRTKADELLSAGATWAGTPVEGAEGADAVISMVGYPSDVEAVHLGPSGTLRAKSVPHLLIDMTTSRPSLAARIAAEAQKRGTHALDAPVSGGDVGARNATLSIMVGGDAAAFAQARPILERLGSTVVLQGGAGAGQHTKMVNQILIAGTMMGVAEGLLYVAKAGLDPATVFSSVGGGAAGSWTVQNLVPRILRGDFQPGFFIEHFVKDLGIAIEEANGMGMELPALMLAKRLYDAAIAAGYGRLGTQAIYRSVAERHGVSVRSGVAS